MAIKGLWNKGMATHGQGLGPLDRPLGPADQGPSPGPGPKAGARTGAQVAQVLASDGMGQTLKPLDLTVSPKQPKIKCNKKK